MPDTADTLKDCRYGKVRNTGNCRKLSCYFYQLCFSERCNLSGCKIGDYQNFQGIYFSDLNNLEIVTTDSRKYETAFGFNREEVERVLMEFGCMDQLEQVRYWYDGFRFGSRTDIYNPWSITKFLDTGRFENFWANTSSNSLVGKLIQEGSPNIKVDMEDLLFGKNIETPVDEEIVSVVYYQPQSEEYVPENDPRLVSEI